MHTRHQRGYLRCAKRKNGQSVWEFLWREDGPTGQRLRRTAVIGTIEQYPTEDLALAAVNGPKSVIANANDPFSSETWSIITNTPNLLIEKSPTRRPPRLCMQSISNPGYDHIGPWLISATSGPLSWKTG